MADKLGSTPDRGTSAREGTDAAIRRKLKATYSPNPAPGAEQTPAPGSLKNSLALRLGGGSLTGDAAGDGGEGKRLGGGSRLVGSAAPSSLSSSLVIQVLADHRRAIHGAVPAIEEALLRLPIEYRLDLAVALAGLNHAMRGGAL